MYCVEAFFIDEGEKTPRQGLFGLLSSDFRIRANRGLSISIAQFYGLVIPGTILTKHIFRGLKRPMFTDGDQQADKSRLAYSRKPAFDCAWNGDPQNGNVEQVDAPQSAVFVVYASVNTGKHKNDYPDIDGWINHWTWVEEDSALEEAPLDWPTRFEKKLFTRSAP